MSTPITVLVIDDDARQHGSTNGGADLVGDLDVAERVRE